MIEHSQDITKLSEALNLAQAEMKGVQKDSKNPHFKNSYASLEAVIDTSKPVLNKHGLAFTQAPGALVDGAVEITTMLMHNSGQWIRSTLHMPVVKRDPQGVGSAITYGLRYSLMAVLGVPPTDDDDGERAMDRSPPRHESKPQAVSRAVQTVADLIAAIKETRNHAALDALTNEPGNINLYENATDAEKISIADEIAAKRQSFGSARAGR
jgi:hypothetical protein